MSSASSVVGLIERFKAGNPDAVHDLWRRYCDRLVRLARRKLGRLPRRMVDEEDVALSAFNSLCAGAVKGRFPDVADEKSLWGLLVFITAQKAADCINHEVRKKRGGGKVRGHSALVGRAPNGQKGSFDAFLASKPGPATLNIWAEEYERLLAGLGDPLLRQIADLSVQRYTVDDIANKLGLARRTIHRKLALIRKALLRETTRRKDMPAPKGVSP
jgi:DNA-directed RNA polymerase specialized sigma24 family protein